MKNTKLLSLGLAMIMGIGLYTPCSGMMKLFGKKAIKKVPSPFKTMSIKKKLLHASIYGIAGLWAAKKTASWASETFFGTIVAPYFIYKDREEEIFPDMPAQYLCRKSKIAAIGVCLGTSALCATLTAFNVYGAKLLFGKALKTLWK